MTNETSVSFTDYIDPIIIEATQPRPVLTCFICGKNIFKCKCKVKDLEYCDYCGHEL